MDSYTKHIGAALARKSVSWACHAENIFSNTGEAVPENFNNNIVYWV